MASHRARPGFLRARGRTVGSLGRPQVLATLAVASGLAGLAACGSTQEGGLDRSGTPDPGDRATLEARTLAAPPDPLVGEWWTVEVDPELVGATFRTTLVVTEREGGRATIGIPPEDFSHHFLVLHIPPLGDIDLETFAWRVMWDDFEALRFPLELGRTWEADFHGNQVVAEVTGVEGSRARVTMTGERERIELTYDAALGMITELREDALKLGFRVLDHGFDYEGPVTSLRGIRLGLMESGPPRPAHPASGEGTRATSTVEVRSGASDGSLSLVLWNLGAEDEPGRYRIVATAPDGATFEETFETTPGSPSVLPASFGHDAVDGTWRIDFEREGRGALLVELFTYDRTDVRLGGGLDR